MADHTHHQKTLEKRLAELTRRLSIVEDELEKPSDQDAEERALEREGDEVLEGLGTAGLKEVRMIEAALDRIRDGSFGVCVSCGDPISDERLSVLPHAPRCRNCA